MNARKSRTPTKNRTVAYIAAGLVHALIIAALLVNFTSKTKTIDAAYADKVDVVKATTVDESEIKKQQEKLKQRELDKQRRQDQERRDLEKLKKLSNLEKKRIEDLKKQQKVEQEKTKQLELERQAIALKTQQEDDKRKKDAAERKRKDVLAAKQRERERQQQEEDTQRRMNESIAAEEAFLAEQRAEQRTTTVVQKYFALIGEQIESVRTVDPSFETWRKSVIDIKVSSSGIVQSVRTIESSGSIRYDSSVEAAVYKASPLPMPDITTEADANERLREFEFVVKHPNARQ